MSYFQLRLPTQRDKDIRNWIRWIVDRHLPLSFCDTTEAHEYVKLSSITSATLKNYIHGATQEVHEEIKASLPAQFGLVFDGWTSARRHYIALFAVFSDPSATPYDTALRANDRKYTLLAFCPLAREDDLSSQSYFDFIADTLAVYDRPWDDVQFLVGDNCSVNQAISRKDGPPPFIGCASHRFNLACGLFKEAHAPLIDFVNAFMKKLTTIKGSAALREAGGLSAFVGNDTRWSSTFDMVARFVELQPVVLGTSAQTLKKIGLAGNALLDEENFNVVTALSKQMDNLNNVTAELQQATITLSAVRRLFDHAVETFPILRPYLTVTAPIENNKELEAGLVTIQRGNENRLSQLERHAVEGMRLPIEEPSKVDETFVEAAYKKHKPAAKSRFIDTRFAPPTSNECERFFSQAKLAFSDLRRALHKDTLEDIVMLRYNSSLWSARTIQQLRVRFDSSPVDL